MVGKHKIISSQNNSICQSNLDFKPWTNYLK